ncbi:Regulator_of chromosome condensation 1/beta-lactamase-inhibitor protein II [Hexamita inflata]|uniref:Regulator of chromosome condensation 1/beta-lactamase-inhibitor protein II n=1 Tax=Hexamita inflata TaxID=28002 RepID=A0AA86RTB2_9EUKA|nr:Regulator of chromosome condensation 1/beta-lactamase-inhibitor protein II [Hexamita inflata]CAI9977584.1 Regulator of chromosome condensation 1/beta-lactamase-inhibitor protein II [Hexamita inflata]
MLFAVCFTQVIELSYTSDKQIQLNYTSTHNVTDYVKCESAFYQISQNGRLMAKGYKKGLLDTSSILDFVNTNILDVVQVFCMRNPDQSSGGPSHLFGYVTKTGEVKREGQLTLNQLTFEDIPSMPKNVKKIVIAEDIILALTNDGLYAMGQCWGYLCGDKDDKELTQFTVVPITPVLPKDIKSIYFNMFIFIHTNNGDVFAVGDNQMEMLPADNYPDESVIRKLWNGARRFQFAQNYSSGEYCSYYISGTDLIMFNHKSKPANTVIEQGVYDFYMDSALVIIKEQSVKFLVEEPTELEFTKLYCKMNPQDTQCSLILSEKFDKTIHCLAISDLCKVKICEDDSGDSSCAISSCADTDKACLAIQCSTTNEVNPKCSAYNMKAVLTVPLLNAKDYIFQDFAMIQVAYSSQLIDTQAPQSQKVSAGGAAGIAVAVCVVVFAAISITTLMILRKNKIATTSNIEAQSNVMHSTKMK